MNKTNKNIKYYYFCRPSTHRHQGVVTIATEKRMQKALNGDDVSEFNFAMAFCSPEDSFVKAKARKIATGRIGSRSFPLVGKVTMGTKIDPNVYPIDLILEIVNGESFKKLMPSWAKRWVFSRMLLGAGASPHDNCWTC